MRNNITKISMSEYAMMIFIFLFFVVTNVNAGRRFICFANFICEPLCLPPLKGKCINSALTLNDHDPDVRA
ncbi:unnamed protein product [Trifolium pratense]|uniref:Uncharacterized protein n=1 Tax=Trifolium pratense TaxID=57577 RepID=A0ACB0KH60_TRIPR|nr:unnamed protein product [Trifolium pratense]